MMHRLINCATGYIGSAVLDHLVAVAPFADSLLLDEQAFGQKARTELGWNPTEPDTLTVIRGKRQ
jgi:hypothetical protein